METKPPECAQAKLAPTSVETSERPGGSLASVKEQGIFDRQVCGSFAA